MSLAEVKLLSIGIERDYAAAYEFLASPANFAMWAEGLAETLRQEGVRWLAATPAGDAEIRFSPRNDYGVLDHWVDFQDGTTVYVPLRIISNGDGCEVTLTLLRLPGMTDEKFQADADWVNRDLARLKQLLETKL